MDERALWHSQLDSAVSTGELHREGTYAFDDSALATLSPADVELTPVADMAGLAPLDEKAPAAASATPEGILAEFDGLARQLSAGAKTVGRLRGSVEQLVETSTELERALETQRGLVTAGEEAQRHDHERIARLEEELSTRSAALAGMRARLGELIRDFESIG